jgi:hypothetical protein
MLLLLQGAPAPSFGVEFQAPAGWLPIAAPPLRAYAAPLSGGEVLVLTIWPAERLGAPEEFPVWFARRLKGPGEIVLQQSEPERRPGNGLEVLTATQRVSLPRQGQVVRVVYAIFGGDRVALAMLTGNRDELITRYADAARGFFESLRFPGAGPPVAEGSPQREPIPAAGFEANRPRGLFYRLQVGLGTTQMETRVLIFLPSQRLLRVYPFGDGNTIDVGRCNPDTCGSYQIDGDRLSVRWDDGNTQRLSLARSGEGFLLDGDSYQPARAVGAAEAVGEWADPAAASATRLRLRADGGFEWGSGAPASTLRGRYEMRGLTLVLHFADGTSKPYALFAAGRAAPLGLISFDGTVYTRR